MAKERTTTQLHSFLGRCYSPNRGRWPLTPLLFLLEVWSWSMLPFASTTILVPFSFLAFMKDTLQVARSLCIVNSAMRRLQSTRKSRWKTAFHSLSSPRKARRWWTRICGRGSSTNSKAVSAFQRPQRHRCQTRRNCDRIPCNWSVWWGSSASRCGHGSKSYCYGPG